MKRTFFCLAFVFGSFAGTFLCTQPVRGEVDAETVNTPKDGDEQSPYICEHPCDPRYDACYDESYLAFVEEDDCEAVAQAEEVKSAEPEDPWSYEGTCWYDCDSLNECEYSWTEEPAAAKEAVAEVTETPAAEEVANDVTNDDYYDYYSEYDEYYWGDDYYADDAEESVAEVVEARVTDAVEDAECPRVAAARITDTAEETAVVVSDTEVAEAKVAPATETETEEAYDYGYDPYDYGYDDYDYESFYESEYYDDEFAWDASANEENVADAATNAEVEVAEVETEEAAEAAVEEVATEAVEEDVVEMSEELYDDEYDYDYGYDYEYDYLDDYSYEYAAGGMFETEEALDAPPEMPLANDEEGAEAQADAILTLANALDQAGKTLQSWSRQLTEMAAPEVAEKADDNIQR